MWSRLPLRSIPLSGRLNIQQLTRIQPLQTRTVFFKRALATGGQDSAGPTIAVKTTFDQKTNTKSFKLNIPLGTDTVLFSPSGSQTLRDLVRDIKDEDASVKSVSFYESSGARVSASSRLEEALQSDLRVVIDGKSLQFSSPTATAPQSAQTQLAEADAFYQSVLAAGTPGTPIPAQMIPSSPEEIARLEREIFPLMREKLALDAKAYAFSDTVLFGGLGAFAAQYIFLARLTWWEFNWDVMEPVTYFITSGTALLAMFYFVLAKQEYTFENVRDGIARRRMAVTYWKSKKFDVEKYFDLEYELKAREPEALLRLESYLQGHTPMPNRFSDLLKK